MQSLFNNRLAKDDQTKNDHVDNGTLNPDMEDLEERILAYQELLQENEQQQDVLSKQLTESLKTNER